MSRKLESVISSRRASIAVVGLGYVGLPLALGFAAKGFSVHGIDMDQDRVRKLTEGVSYITDVSDKELKKVLSRKTFQASTDFNSIAHCHVVIICVPTPIRKKYSPDVSFMLGAVRSVAKVIRKGTLVILESTTYPGTTEEMIKPELEKSGLKVGCDIYLAFSPERIDPGNPTHTVTLIPKVVGGVTPRCSQLTALLYGQIIKNVHVVSSPAAAEMTKLLENTFRIVNIGWVNEAAMMCHKFGVDIWEVIDAAKTKPFGFMPFYPGLGVGGHCIPEDPIYLYWKAKQKGHASKFIKLSADINASMPDYVVDRIKEALGRSTLKGARILVLGVTYKKNVKDLRKSPSLRLIDIFGRQGVGVGFFDPLVPYLDINGIRMRATELTAKNISSFDCVVVAVDHDGLDYKQVLSSARLVFDAKNVFKGQNSKKIVKL